jgi:hypothetical protein
VSTAGLPQRLDTDGASLHDLAVKFGLKLRTALGVALDDRDLVPLSNQPTSD